MNKEKIRQYFIDNTTTYNEKQFNEFFEFAEDRVDNLDNILKRMWETAS